MLGIHARVVVVRFWLETAVLGVFGSIAIVAVVALSWAVVIGALLAVRNLWAMTL